MLSHRFTFLVEVEVERMEGKFASRDELADWLLEAIEGSDPGSFSGGQDGTSEYETVSFEVTEQEQEKRSRKS